MVIGVGAARNPLYPRRAIGENYLLPPTAVRTTYRGDQVRWSGHQVLAASHLDNDTSMPWRDDVRAKLMSYLPPDTPQAHVPVKGRA